MEVYLDNSATTRVYPETAELMMKILTEDFGNPSSMHKCGVTAEHYVRDAQADAAKSIHALPEEILFTSGGTESNNEALMGTALARKRTGMHILSTNVEHPSVGAALDFLEKEGFLVTRLPVNAYGIVTPEQVTEALRPDTILVSVMMVNNEIGSIFPIEDIAKAVHKKNPKTYVHTDAIQAYGKLPINVSKLNVDLLSVSSHKLHGPKGVGFLYVRKGLLLRPIIYGGGQQKGMRSGTENVPGIAGFASAIRRKDRRPSGQTDRRSYGSSRGIQPFLRRTAYRQHQLYRGKSGGNASQPGVRGDLCIRRFSLFLQQEEREQCA